ncbi:MAG: hypothetical protein M0P69_16935 [Bacteroidales bacterium]|jgi:hypothetical protein|nr:hypothetical protein [Bacteroidales bacterium]
MKLEIKVPRRSSMKEALDAVNAAIDVRVRPNRRDWSVSFLKVLVRGELLIFHYDIHATASV